jgi:hypothetical protein
MPPAPPNPPASVPAYSSTPTEAEAEDLVAEIRDAIERGIPMKANGQPRFRPSWSDVDKAARTCLAQTIDAAQALGTAPHDCRTMPILFVGSDAHEAAVHDFNAIFVGETPSQRRSSNAGASRVDFPQQMDRSGPTPLFRNAGTELLNVRSAFREPVQHWGRIVTSTHSERRNRRRPRPVRYSPSISLTIGGKAQDSVECTTLVNCRIQVAARAAASISSFRWLTLTHHRQCSPVQRSFPSGPEVGARHERR